MDNKRIFITGGAGYLGKNIIRRYYENNEITIYSRDEAKHYFSTRKYPKGIEHLEKIFMIRGGIRVIMGEWKNV